MVATGIDIVVLGPVELSGVDLGPRRQRFVFGVLALQANRVVPVRRLTTLIWPDGGPRTAVHAVRVAVSRLRAALKDAGRGDVRIATRGDGYVLLADPACIDAGRFLAQLELARGCDDPRERITVLEAALALWTGAPLAGTAVPEIRELEHARLAARRDLIDARLAAGEGARLVPELTRLTAEHPYDEQVHGWLMLALYRAGRQADALAVYRRLRQALDLDLGIEPGQPLRDLERAILRQDPALDPHPPPASGPTAEPATEPTTGPVPAQLPPALPAFVGRAGELADLDAALTPSTTGVLVVSGTAGVGKTTLAVQWAHRVADRFPDGRLYVNLRGFDPAGTPLDPAAAVRGFLDAFAVPADRVPPTLEAQTALYRSLLADRRVLVVLDNARSAEQVRPLLPGGTRCLTVVTSRSRLAPLVAAEGATPVTLDLLTDPEARELLGRRVGRRRVDAEPVAAGEIVARCAGLPLALAVVGARVVTRPRFTLADVAGELRRPVDGLDALRAGDAHTDVRSVLSWSYRTLSTAAARLFRLLGRHPGPDVTVAAAASLAGVPAGRVREPLDELTGAHLLTEHAPGRYVTHDLLRAIAAERCDRVDPPAERTAASHRALDHYLRTAHAAAVALDPHRDAIALAPPLPGVTPEPVDDHLRALAWFDAERAVLLSAVDHAAANGFDAHVCQLAWALADVLERRGRWPEFAATQRAALAAARRAGDVGEQARAHRTLSRAYLRLRRLPDAHRHLGHAADLSRSLGDTAGQAHAHLNLAELSARQGAERDALDHARRARDLFRTAGHRSGLGLALNAVGWFHARVGEYPQALDACTGALALMRDLGDRAGQAATWDSLGYAHLHAGNRGRAVTCYRRAVALYHLLGDRYEEATSLANLGDAFAGRHASADRAADAWTRALAILDELGHPDADGVRSRLRRDYPSPARP
ncbi:AfsR/SARP family transcriptional regulator [Virgisporangium aurantiacum]|uniref:SARP family transcriptional regulator n=1 Tax=Virgisporangium aurantiacum TaxID=175570 RepID=A0A8J4E178_9ACTN|nr:BTAD domain-containing putative transcriptional regulator [Virgisporangium aurantiacum]GIJ57478.1 SARP family transcriptional regulator [Virgisporangium aurantiacum]